MSNQSIYLLRLTSRLDDAFVERAFELTWRFEFAAPGFCAIDVGASLNSHSLRRLMIDLKTGLSELLVRRSSMSLCFRSMGRFDQQETTKFHLDGAPEQSMLLLGYEPSKVISRLFLADYSRASFDMGITPQQFLQDFNPMFSKNEERLNGYTTELPQPEPGHARILLVNNSALPFNDERRNPLGVMHKAIIVTPNAAERRIVNSTMLDTEGNELTAEKLDEFVTTEGISEKFF